MPTDPVAGEVPDLVLRPAGQVDLPGIATLFLRVRDAVVPDMPAIRRTAAEVRAYVTAWDLERRDVWVAEVDRSLVAFMVLEEDWLDSLYVAPEQHRHGVGTALLELAKQLRTDGFSLWVFESNLPARRFYAKHGLVELERTDGSGNEERSPDIRVAWPGREPLDFLRRLIDEVDEQLGDLLARRVALSHAIQPRKRDPSRDPAREREIVDRLAARVPALRREHVAAILDAIVSGTLDAAGE